MRKKLALLLAAIMVIGMIPMTAFATTTNRITKVVTGSVDKVLTGTNVPQLKIYEKDLDDVASGQTVKFELDLANAEWSDFTPATIIDGSSNVNVAASKIQKLTNKSMVIEAVMNGTKTNGHAYININLATKLKTEGDATVTIDPLTSVVSSGTYKFATVADGDATVTIEKKSDVSESGNKDLKALVIKETAAGALKNGTLKVKISNDWTINSLKANIVGAGVTIKNAAGTITATNATTDVVFPVNDQEVELTLTTAGTTEAAIITLVPNVSYDDNEIEPGDIAEITVSGSCGVQRTTVEAAKAVTYGVTWTAEDKELPVFYSGTADEDIDTLEVTMEESVMGSWITGRKAKIVFPEGVRVLGVNITESNGQVTRGAFTINDDGNELTFDNTWRTLGTDTAKVKFEFQLSIAASFTGDITATLTGKGVDEEIEVVVGKAVAPITASADATDVVIDYRHTPVGDITITEVEPGVLKKNSTVSLYIAKGVPFDNKPKVEVVSGDLKVDNVKRTGNTVTFKIDGESAKTPATIKLTNCEVLLDRTVASGSYGLSLNAVDYKAKTGITWTGTGYAGLPKMEGILANCAATAADDEKTPFFYNDDEISICKEYVNVVTAGRDVDDSTFTTTLKVTIGATEMLANDKVITLDVPAYISNGYTMLPVRAVTEALSGSAIVRWDDATKTVTITFGSRVINMTVGSKVMVINGVDVPMQAACEITNSRAFIPLRDMGYALGLNDSKINWEDASKTATLN